MEVNHNILLYLLGIIPQEKAKEYYMSLGKETLLIFANKILDEKSI